MDSEQERSELLEAPGAPYRHSWTVVERAQRRDAYGLLTRAPVVGGRYANSRVVRVPSPKAAVRT